MEQFFKFFFSLVFHHTLQNLIPTNKPGAEPKRPGRPVDITPLCNLTPSVVNTIVVSWAVQESKVSFVWFH